MSPEIWIDDNYKLQARGMGLGEFNVPDRVFNDISIEDTESLQREFWTILIYELYDQFPNWNWELCMKGDTLMKELFVVEGD